VPLTSLALAGLNLRRETKRHSRSSMIQARGSLSSICAFCIIITQKRISLLLPYSTVAPTCTILAISSSIMLSSKLASLRFVLLVLLAASAGACVRAWYLRYCRRHPVGSWSQHTAATRRDQHTAATRRDQLHLLPQLLIATTWKSHTLLSVLFLTSRIQQTPLWRRCERLLPAAASSTSNTTMIPSP